ncbi:unnamed protein product [Linum trigynum]|uniref:Uncharacterized protein n=1 Tax=Linum trigynum TaxID=586398 RepID=A0AAV2GR42_9ROSI
MPGNEVGDRIHNFFGQETSSQVPQHSQIADAAWHGMIGNPWAGGQGQIATPVISDLKNRSSQQPVADYERRYGGQSSPVQRDLSFQQSIERAEHARSQSQDQQPTRNGFFQGHQSFQTRQNETNFMGVDTEPDRHNLTSKGFSAFDSHQGNGPDFHKRNLVRMDSTESPVNFNFLGGQHQMSSQHPGTVQSLPRQPLGVGDMQLLQQQLILKQMQEFQRQRQLQMQQMQQQESTRQLNISNNVSSLGKHELFSQSRSMINGIPIQDASGYALQPEVMAANMNLQQHSMSPDMRGSSSRLGFSSEQNQTFQMMGMVPQQVDQSLYGIPIAGTRVTSSHFSPIQVDKAPVQQMSSNSNSLMDNQYMVSSNQANVQEGTLGSRQGYQGRNVIERVDSQGFGTGINLERLQQVNSWQSSVPAQEFLRTQDGSGLSESSQEKTVAHAVSSQNAAALDPTEERILYGSDDNLWDAFGNSNHVGSGGLNTESTDASSGALSSLQSGTWSALMQSAVAEASSVDVSAQEEWSGPDGQGTELQNGNRHIRTVNDTGKQQTAWAGNSFQTGSILNNPFHRPDNNATSINSNEMQRVHCSGVSSPHDERERSQVDSFWKFSQQFVKGNTKWLDGSHQLKAAAEVSRNLEKAVHSPDAESSAKNLSHPCTNQSGSHLHNPSGQSFIKQNGWNFIDPASSSTSSALKNQGNQNLLLPPSTNDQKCSMGKNSWRTDPVSNSAVGIVHAQSSTGSPPANIPDSSHNSTPVFSSMMLNQDSSQDIPPQGNNLDVWKRVDPVMNYKRREITGNHSLNMEEAHEAFESSGHNSLGNGAVTASELDHLGVIQNTMNSLTTTFHNVNARETNWKDTNNSGILLAGNQKLSSHAGKKPSVRKFQYHPMGDVDVDSDSSHATTPDARSESIMQRISAGSRDQEEGHIGQSELTNLSTSLDRGVNNYTPNKKMIVSQNMLELLHKVDHSSETANSTYFSSSSQNPSPETETHDRTLRPEQKRSSVSQGEKSRAVMAPMSLVQSFPPAHETSQGEVRNKVPNILGQTTSIDHGRIPAAFPPGFPNSRSNAQDLQMREIGKEVSANQSVNESFVKFVSQTKQSNEPVDGAGSSQSGLALVPDTSRGTTCNDVASSVEVTHLDNFQNNRDSGHQFPVLEASSTSQSYAGSGLQQDGASKNSATLRTTTSSTPLSFGTLPFPLSSNAFESNIQLSSTAETTSWPKKLEYQNPQGRGSNPSASGATSVKHVFAGTEQLERYLSQSQLSLPVNDFTKKMMSPLPGKDSIINRVSNLYASSAVSTQMDIAAFGRSLRPNASLSQNYSLLHQVQDVKNREVDPTGRSLKRLKGSDGSVDPQLATSECGQQLLGHANAVRGALLNRASSSPDDPKAVGLSGRQTDEHGPNLPTQDMHEFGGTSSRNFADSNDGVSGRGEHSQISPQMAPSWFNQYGTFKNGHVLSTYDARKVAAMKHAELALSGSRSSIRLPIPGPLEAGSTISDDASQHGLVRRSSTPLVSEEFSFPQLLRPDSVDMSLFVVRPKKRKSAPCDLVPWHKELIMVPHRLRNISLAEVEWAKAVSRVTDKVEDDVEIIDDGPPAIKSKKRLILTTQLMQLLLHPPPSWVMSADAISQYEIAAHFVARSTLGDVCGSLSVFASDASPPSNSSNILPERLRYSKSKSDQYFSKVMEDIIERTRKVESDLLRLDRSISILDLRVECEDLEKFSVINRFAKFHGPGQTAGGQLDTSSGSTSNAQKAFLQRYVTALPFPRNIPDRVQCLSL